MQEREPQKELFTLKDIGDALELFRTLRQNGSKLSNVGKEVETSFKKDPRALVDILNRGVTKATEIISRSYLEREKERIRIKAEALKATLDLEALGNERIAVQQEKAALDQAASEHVNQSRAATIPENPSEAAGERVRRWTQKLNNLTEDIKKQSDENVSSSFSSLFK